MSKFHFQRMFSAWAGGSPKRFLQYLTKEYAKHAFRQSADVLGAAYPAGLSAPSRLHDLIVSRKAVKPGKYKSAGKGLSILYGYAAPRSVRHCWAGRSEVYVISSSATK